MTEQNPKLKTLREKAMSLPLVPGVYIMKNSKGAIIYIGKAKALKNRVSQYFGSDRNLGEKVRQMVIRVNDFDYIITDSEYEALVLENSLIKQNMPKYNILLKDDKGYCYIRITNDAYPRIKEAKQILKDDSKYLGPYMSIWAVQNIVDETLKIFKLPVCNRVFPRDFKKYRPCLNYYIKQCDAPCKGNIDKDTYNKTIREAIDFIKSGASESVKRLEAEMNEEAENLNFEKAAKLRDRINLINRIREKQKVVKSSVAFQDVIATALNEGTIAITILKFQNNSLSDREDHILQKMGSVEETVDEFLLRYYENSIIPPRICVENLPSDVDNLTRWLSEKAQKKVEFFVPQRGEQLKLLQMCKVNANEKLAEGKNTTGRDISTLDELANLLGLEDTPNYIESYDISNLSGGENVGGMVVFENARPLKKAYRKFKIKTIIGQDDYGSMSEVITRRFKEYELHKETGEGFGRLPDLILLDGGKGHVSTIAPLIERYGIPVFGMVKDDKHKTRAITGNGGEVEIQSTRRAFTLISNIQEEVHRYAISYHRSLRKKSNLSSSLLEIDGVGKERAKALLAHFKTIKNIKNASVEELLNVSKMTEKVAKNIVNYFENV